MNPIVSIITVSLNDREGLQKTIESILSQTFNEFEYIIIDGGSTDGSMEIIKRVETKLAYHVSEKDNGIYHAMNKGLNAAKGTYCLFLNAGDFLCSTHVLATVFKNELKEDIVSGDMLYDCGDAGIQYCNSPDELTFGYMYSKFLFHPATFIKGNLLKQLGRYNEKFKIAADHEFFFNAVVMNKASYRHIPFAISQHNNRGISSMPENFEAVMKERRSVYEKYLPAMVIVEMDNYVSLLHSNSYRYVKLISKYPFLIKIAGKINATILKIAKLMPSKKIKPDGN